MYLSFKTLKFFTQINEKSNIDSFQSQFNEWKKSASKFGMHKSIMRPIFDDDDDDHENKQNDNYAVLKLKYQIKNVNNNTMKEFFIDNAFIKLMKKIFNVISSQTGSTK